MENRKSRLQKMGRTPSRTRPSLIKRLFRKIKPD
jgi:hypothetical protein